MSAGNSSDVNQGTQGEKSKLKHIAELRSSESTDETRQQKPPSTPGKQSESAHTEHLHTMSFTPENQQLVAHRIAVEIAADWMNEEGEKEYWMDIKSLPVLEEIYKDCSEHHRRVRSAWGFYKVYTIKDDVEQLKTALSTAKKLLTTLMKDIESKSSCTEVIPPNNQVNPNQTDIANGNSNNNNIVTPSVTNVQPTVAQTTTATTATPIFKVPAPVKTVGVHVGQINSTTAFATTPATNATVQQSGMQHSAAGTYSSATASPVNAAVVHAQGSVSAAALTGGVQNSAAGTYSSAIAPLVNAAGLHTTVHNPGMAGHTGILKYPGSVSAAALTGGAQHSAAGTYSSAIAPLVNAAGLCTTVHNPGTAGNTGILNYRIDDTNSILSNGYNISSRVRFSLPSGSQQHGQVPPPQGVNTNHPQFVAIRWFSHWNGWK